MSDLHVGAGARSRDLCPTNVPTDAIEDGYRDRFFRFLKKHSKRADYLVLPGDVTHFANPDEFTLASDFIQGVISALKIPPSQVVFVPGNHDVNWDVLKHSGSKAFWRSLRYAPLANEELIFSRVLKRGAFDILHSPHFCIWTFDDVLVVGYDSSWDDDPTKAIHHGEIANAHLDELESLLPTLDLSPKRIRIFLVHHHPVQYSDPVNDPPDFSVMVNAERLLKLLRAFDFDFLIHGHKHKPSFGTHIIDSGAPLAILGSGSFSVELDTRWSGIVNNQFHLIHVDGRDSLGTIYGLIESWTYLTSKGWVPSKMSNGIRHTEPFGTYVLPEQLKSLLRPIITTALNSKTHVGWSEIVSNRPEFGYLALDRVVAVLDSLCIELGLKRFGEPPDEFILVR